MIQSALIGCSISLRNEGAEQLSEDLDDISELIKEIYFEVKNFEKGAVTLSNARHRRRRIYQSLDDGLMTVTPSSEHKISELRPYYAFARMNPHIDYPKGFYGKATLEMNGKKAVVSFDIKTGKVIFDGFPWESLSDNEIDDEIMEYAKEHMDEIEYLLRQNSRGTV